MRIMIALLLAWAAGLIAELGGARDVPTAWVVATFLVAWRALGSIPALRCGRDRA